MTDLAKFEDLTPAAVDRDCVEIEAWAAETESIPELQEMKRRLAAVDQYIASKTKEGRGRLAATMRRLEVRIGELLGRAQRGGNRKTDQVPRAEDDLPGSMSAKERSELRKMADHKDKVEREVVKSSDDEPVSRRKVLEAIKDPAQPPDTGPSAAAKLARWARELSENMATITPSEAAEVLATDQQAWAVARAEWDGVIGWLNALFKLRPRQTEHVTRQPPEAEEVVHAPGGFAQPFAEEAEASAELDRVEKSKGARTAKVRVLEVEHRAIASMWQWRLKGSPASNNVALKSDIVPAVKSYLALRGDDPKDFGIKLVDWSH